MLSLIVGGHKIKVGDRLICKKHVNNYFTIGKSYIIKEIVKPDLMKEHNDYVIRFIDYTRYGFRTYNHPDLAYIWNFFDISIKEKRKEKLERLSKCYL
jgi:hypothetical protein